MPGFLKQSTASQSRAIGPFVDDIDFKTPETGLTIANTDIKLVVNGGASANKNSGGGTHRVNGVYGVTFDATDTATVGEMEVSVVVTGALPVFDKFFVLEEAVYDALFAAAAPGFATVAALATVQADTDDIQTRLPAALTGDGNIKADTLRVGGTLQTAGDIIGDTNDIQARLPAVLVSGRIDASVGAMAADVVTAAAIAADAIGSAEFSQAAADKVWSTASRTLTAFAFSVNISAAAVQAIWDALTSALVTVGSIGKLLVDNINATISSRSTFNAASDQVIVVTNNDKTGYRLSATGVDDIHDEAVDGAVTLRESIRLANSANGAKTAGMSTATGTIRDLADTKDRVTATLDGVGNRTAVTRDLT